MVNIAIVGNTEKPGAEFGQSQEGAGCNVRPYLGFLGLLFLPNILRDCGPVYVKLFGNGAETDAASVKGENVFFLYHLDHFYFC
jgi:hypothetical protein